MRNQTTPQSAKCNWTIEKLEEWKQSVNCFVTESEDITKLQKSKTTEIDARIESAKQRFIVGKTAKGDNVYIATSQYRDDEYTLWVEGKASGWAISECWNGQTMKVCIDGGTRWFEEITFDTDWKAPRRTERGAAELKVVLHKGAINVYHADGTLLATRVAYEGDWDRLFDALSK